MEVLLNNELIAVNIVRKKNKNIYFRFDDELNLVVTANKYISEKEIKKLIEKNINSLSKMLSKVERKRQKENEFWYLGSSYNILFDNTIKDIEFIEGTIICKDEATLNKFIKNKTKEIFTREVDNLKTVIKTPAFTLRIRKMKTRWGVCNYKSMTITLNSELIKYRLDLLRYVIVHEMCHFYHHDHSKNFWNMVSIYYPEYKQARKELRD